jgi:hypothetical protein
MAYHTALASVITDSLPSSRAPAYSQSGSSPPKGQALGAGGEPLDAAGQFHLTFREVAA